MKNGTEGGEKALPTLNEDEKRELDFGLLPELVGRQLRIAHLLAFKDFAVDISGTNLTPGSFEILELLEHNAGIGQSRLAAAIGLEKSSLVPAIGRLEDLGLVARKQSGADKRANELRITPAGSKVLGDLRTYILARDQQITHGMSRAEVAELNRLLKKMAQICG